MEHALWLGNARLLLFLNHALASKPELYHLGLLLTDKVADLLTVLTFALLWFWPDTKNRQYLTPHRGAAISPIIGAIQATRLRWMQSLSREQSRAQFLVLGFAGAVGYASTRLIAFELDISRPFATFLPVHAGVAGAFEGLRTFGSFPSDHAVLLAALPVALLFWDKKLAIAWAVLGTLLAVTRVAVGFHYPLDMIGGAFIGVLITAGTFAAYQKRGWFRNSFNVLALGFELKNAPYCYLLYFLLLMGGLEFAMHFQHVLGLIFTMRAEVMVRFGI